MTSFTLKAPAKLNVYLRLMGRRADGYNNLITIFHRIALHDRLTFYPAAKGLSIECAQRGVPKGPKNLISIAFKKLREETGFSGGARVVLEKHIPAKAGLGGASSDAATALIGFNRLFKLKLSKWQLCEIGRSIGADVPFFLTKDRLSLGIGRGDELVSLDCGRERVYYVLFVFKKGLSTQDVYKKHRYGKNQTTLTKIIHDVTMIPLFLQKRDVTAIARITYNDLLRPARLLMPDIQALINELRARNRAAVQMTGSGSTVYAILRNRKEATHLAKQYSSHKKFSVIVTQSY